MQRTHKASERFRAMTEMATLVPSIAVQAWCSTDAAGLGWPPTQAMTVGRGEKDRHFDWAGPARHMGRYDPSHRP